MNILLIADFHVISLPASPPKMYVKELNLIHVKDFPSAIKISKQQAIDVIFVTADKFSGVELDSNVPVIILLTEEDLNKFNFDLKITYVDFLVLPANLPELILRAKRAINVNIQQVNLNADIDFLTKIYTKKYFLSHAGLNTNNYSILMIDIDNFKLVNDKFGHLIGDSVLTEVAARLEYSLREEDIIARFGGDEFIIYLPITSEHALIVAQRLCNYICKKSFNNDLSISISIGVAGSIKSDSLLDVIAKADKKLYLAKSTGKNKVCF